MGRFNLLEYDEENMTLDVGAGVTWGTAYNYLQSIQKYVPFDRELGIVGGDPHVGITGYLLGGGYSLLTNRFGLGSDNIVGIQIILPGSGELRNVSSTEDPDLFKALKVRPPCHMMTLAYIPLISKGGAHNFGVITRFTLQVHDYAKIVSSTCRQSELSLMVIDVERSSISTYVWRLRPRIRQRPPSRLYSE